MVDFKITKSQMILETNNDMAHNYYFLIHGRIYNEDKTKYRRFKYVEWFDIFDVMEFFEKEYITIQDVKAFLSNIENVYLYNIKDFDDKESLSEFYSYCNETIRNFNKILI